MSTNKDDRPRGPTRNGPERRRPPWRAADKRDAKTLEVESLKGRLDSKVEFDSKGDPVLEWKVPARRASDNEKTFLKYLENRSLGIADDDNWIAKSKRRSIGYNPYDKPPKS